MGIEGYGGARGGVDAVAVAAQNQHLDVMAMLNPWGSAPSSAHAIE